MPRNNIWQGRAAEVTVAGTPDVLSLSPFLFFSPFHPCTRGGGGDALPPCFFYSVTRVLLAWRARALSSICRYILLRLHRYRLSRSLCCGSLTTRERKISLRINARAEQVCLSPFPYKRAASIRYASIPENDPTLSRAIYLYDGGYNNV